MSKFKITVKKVKNTKIKTKRQALQMSYDHWDEMYKAKKTDLLEVFDDKTVGIWISNCACCKKYKIGMFNCGECPLASKIRSTGCCNGLWGQVDDSLDEYDDKNCKWKDVKKAFKTVRDYIGEKIKELK